MVRVSIILPQACSLVNSITQLCTVFECANSCLSQQQEEALFAVHLVGATSQVHLYGNLFSVKPHYTLNDPSENDLVIIPALAGNIADGLKNNRVFIPWIIEQYQHGAEIAGLCTGAFLLADTHLVNDTGCNKTWYVSAGFRKEFSQVNGVAEKLVLEEKAISTDSGAYTFINRLLEKSANTSLAAACAALFETEFNRECQSIFSIAHRERRTGRSNKKLLPSSPFQDRFYPTPDHLKTANIPDDPKISSQKKNSVMLKELFRAAIGK
jgi:transcriptional regulator GlxA family with amidase domain